MALFTKRIDTHGREARKGQAQKFGADQKSVVGRPRCCCWCLKMSPSTCARRSTRESLLNSTPDVGEAPTGRAEFERAEAGRAETGRAETGRTELGRARFVEFEKVT